MEFYKQILVRDLYTTALRDMGDPFDLKRLWFLVKLNPLQFLFVFLIILLPSIVSNSSSLFEF